MKSIQLIRGDTEQIKLIFRKDGVQYKPSFIEEGDVFTFSVRNKIDNNLVLQKIVKYPEDTFNIKNEDTKRLEFGKYDYDIEYSKPDKSIVKTVVVDTLIINKEVSY